MAIQLRAVEFDPCEEIALYQDKQQAEQRGKYGAVVSFVGTMRDFNAGRAVQAMTLEHYPGMTENHLQKICAEAERRWDILDSLIIHRVGEIRPNDPIVLVAVWSAHRAAAFDLPLSDRRAQDASAVLEKRTVSRKVAVGRA